MNINSKEMVLAIVANMSEEKCDEMLQKIYEKADNVCTRLGINLANSAQADEFGGRFIAVNREPFDESKHPRAADGKWTSGAPSYLGKRGAEKWEKTGKATPSPTRFPETLAKINRFARLVRFYEDGSHENERRKAESDLVAAQRELAEKMREYKHAERVKIETPAKRKYMTKLARNYREIDEDIDYMQEKYADRENADGELKFPETKRGRKEKAKYEKLLSDREELLKEIDWDFVEDDE